MPSPRTHLVLFALAVFASVAWADGQPTSASPQAEPRPVVLVRVLSLEGTGPDNEEHILFRKSDGFVTTLDALGRVGSQVSGTALAEGGYHTLFVQLADDYELLSIDGTRLGHRFSDEGRPTRLRVRGMIMVSNGKATPLRMLDEPSFYGSRREAFQRRHDGDDD